MSPDPSTGSRIALDLARQLLQYAREQGLAVDELLAAQDLLPGPLADQPAYTSGERFERALALVLPRLPDPLPGLYATGGPVASQFGLFGFLLQTSSSVGKALETLFRMEPLIGDTATTRMRFEPGAVHITWDTRFTDPYVRAQTADFILGAYARGLAALVRPGMRVIEAVHLRHPAPADPALLQRYLDAFAAPVYFDQPEYLLVVPPAVLDLPLPGADPQLHEVLEQHARRLLEERAVRTASFVDLVRSRLHQLLHKGDASRELLAEALGMSSRTLHRKLQEAGTSYRDLLDGLRLDRVRALLRDSTLTIAQVAERAGFDESHSFARWFRQLTGIAPSEFRQGVRDGDPGA